MCRSVLTMINEYRFTLYLFVDFSLEVGNLVIKKCVKYIYFVTDYLKIGCYKIEIIFVHNLKQYCWKLYKVNTFIDFSYFSFSINFSQFDNIWSVGENILWVDLTSKICATHCESMHTHKSKYIMFIFFVWSTERNTPFNLSCWYL